MTPGSYTTAFTVEQSPEEVFNAVTNVTGWWSEEVKGGTSKVNDEFDYHYKDQHRCRIRLTEVVPSQKIVWLVLENYFHFTQDKTEWSGTKIIFEISRVGDKTQLRFTHDGLVPAYECFNICQDAWTHYIRKSLYDLITTGKGAPNPKEGGFNGELLEKHTIDQSN